MIKLYGVPMSRASRCLWMLEELGVEYENEPVNFVGDAQKPDYLKINPNGKIPALDDDGLILFESLAINLHLASKHGRAPLWPASQDDRSRSIQWSIWAMTEAEPPVMAVLLNRSLAPEDQRDEAAAKAGERALEKPLGVLEGALAGRDYLLGSDFSVADLNVAGVIGWLASFKAMDLSSWPNVERWCQACNSRPALGRARQQG